MIETRNLTALARTLETRWRFTILAGYLGTTLIVSAALSLLLVLADVLFSLPVSVGRMLLLINGAGVATAMVLSALQRRSAQQLLADADNVYETDALLCSAIEFGQTQPSDHNTTEFAFRSMVATAGNQSSAEIDPTKVFPLKLPARTSIAGALVIALAVLLLLDASGWFARPTVELSQEGLLLEDAGRRLAERSDNTELTQLAEEIRRLGERLRDGQLDSEEARRRIDKLGEEVEEQMRNLERLDEFATNPNTEIPPETEDAVRSALRSGMTDGEVLEFFMSMRADGDTLPDTLNALEGATADRPPDANLSIDSERVQELLDQLNLTPESSTGSDLAEDLDSARQTLQQAGAGVESITEGRESEFGDPGQSAPGGRLGPEDPADQEETAGADSDAEGESNAGQQGGETAVADAMDDTFTRIEEANPIFREIDGIVGEGTIRDVIIRELPSQALSEMTEAEREVAFERVIEEAVGREGTPPELQHLVRNYFLRITLGNDQGEQDEQ